MITIHLLTQNNESTIESTLKNIVPLDMPIIIADMGSSDATQEICNSYGISTLRLSIEDRSAARNEMTKLSKTKMQMYIEPWEIIIRGEKDIVDFNDNCYKFSILKGKIITKDVRVWMKGMVFQNPIKEKISHNGLPSKVILSSKEEPNLEKEWRQIQKWKKQKPMDIDVYYHEAMNLLLQKRYKDFTSAAQQYIFSNKKDVVPTTMTRYYLSLVYLLNNNINDALKNISLCIAENPLMAEFWCLCGDIHLHANQPKKSIDFYENAIILGSRRLEGDNWPMNIEKYKRYPEKMIEICKEIKSKTFTV